MHEILNGKKGIFFDLGWTLCEPSTGEWMIPYRMLDYISDAPSNERLLGALAECAGPLGQHHRVSTMEEEYVQFLRFYTDVNRTAQLGLDDAAIEEIARDKVFNPDNLICFEETIPVLTELKKHFRLGVISDTWPSIHTQLDNSKITHLFDCFTFSFELGAYKPDPALYAAALERMGLAPEETIFIDDLPKNLVGARNAGITPVLITAMPGHKGDDRFVQIKSVRDLLG